LIGHHAEQHPGPAFQEVAEVEVTVALVGAAVAEGEQPAKAGVGGAVGRPGQHVGRPVAKSEPASDSVKES
jgi:hypothetical protein